MSIIILLLANLLVIGFTNKTFFKNYYQTTNFNGEKVRITLPIFSYYQKVHGSYEVTFDTIRSVKSISKILNKYLENLPSCYDESYFYDQDLDITISRYSVEDNFPFNRINLVYTDGNYCENEYVLADNWISEFIEKSKIEEVNIKKCVISNSIIKCTEKSVDKKYVINIFDFVANVDYTRIENKKNLNIDESKDHSLISVYYTIDNQNYVLSVFIYNDKYLTFKITDANDHPKNALYDVDQDLNLIFENLYNNSNNIIAFDAD